MNTINLQHKLATDFYIDYRVAENGVIIDEKHSTQAPVVDPGKQIMKTRSIDAEITLLPNT